MKKMTEQQPFVKAFDIIEINPSHYYPSNPISNKYVVIGSLDGFDAEIIDENGKYTVVCGEDYKVIGNANDMREEYWNGVKKRQDDMERKHKGNKSKNETNLEKWLKEV